MKEDDAQREAEEAAREKERAKEEGAEKWMYAQWVAHCDAFFDNFHAKLADFPIPTNLRDCKRRDDNCVMGEKLGICHHQLSELLMGSGEYELGWLKKERLRWHPDEFPGRGPVQDLAKEMFQLVQKLIDG